MDLKLISRNSGRCVIVEVIGECDASTAAVLRELLLGLLARRSAWMVVDLTRLEFLDCAGARALLTADRRAAMLGGSLAVAAPPVPVARLLRLTGFAQCLAIFPSVATCVAGLRLASRRPGLDQLAGSPIWAVGARRQVPRPVATARTVGSRGWQR